MRAGLPNPFLFDYTPGDSVAAKGGSFSRSSPATYLDQNGVLQTAAAGVLRDAHYQGTLRTTLLEAAKTNLCLYSQDQSQAAGWGHSGSGTVTPNTTVGMDGTLSATRIQVSGSFSFRTQAITVSAGVTYTWSFWAKNNGGTAAKYRAYDVTHAADIVAATSFFAQINGSTWTRVSLTFTTPAGCTQVYVYPASDSSSGGDYLVWGGQLEACAYPTSYIETAAAAVARAADNLTFPFTFGVQDLTVYARVARPAHADAGGDIGGWPRLFDISTAFPYLSVYFDKTSRNLYAQTYYAAGSAVNSPGRTVPTDNSIRLCAQFKNLTTAPACALDAGAGMTAFGSTGTGYAGFGNGTISLGVSTASDALNAGLMGLRIMAGLQTMATMRAGAGAAAEVGARVHLIELDFSGGPLYLTTAPLNILATVPYPDGTTASHTFSAIGGTLGIEEIAEGTDIGSQRAKVHFSGVDPTVIAAVLENGATGLTGYLWRAYLTPSWAIDTVSTLFAGYLNGDWACEDRRPGDPREPATAEISTELVDSFSDFDQSRGIQTALASHQSVAEHAAVLAGATSQHRFADDLFTQYVAVMPWKRFQWGDVLFTVNPTLPYQQRGGGATASQRR